MICYLDNLSDCLNFSRYEGCTLADVMDMDPGFVYWAMLNTTTVLFIITDNAMEEIKAVYPEFLVNAVFEEHREDSVLAYEMMIGEENLREDYEEYLEEFGVERNFGRYSGSWAQDVEGYSDEEIDIIFDGDPYAYWNID